MWGFSLNAKQKQPLERRRAHLRQDGNGEREPREGFLEMGPTKHVEGSPGFDRPGIGFGAPCLGDG